MSKGPRLIQVQPWGSEGWIPTPESAHECIHRGEVSCCTSSSGCGGYAGATPVYDVQYVICTEDHPPSETDQLFDAVLNQAEAERAEMLALRKTVAELRAAMLLATRASVQ